MANTWCDSNQSEQIWFQAYLTISWISYFIAIRKDPGSPPINFEPNQGEWRRWCKKCQNYKPERSHHCKSCQKCVLKMDHHCPWTMNCVGHGNFPHFLRFLLWVIWTSGYIMVQLSKRVIQYYEERNLPAYLIPRGEMLAVVFLLPIDFFMFISILILFIRCLINFMVKGMTQIEVWESERIEGQFHTERFWRQIRSNYFKLHNKALPKLTSWRTENERIRAAEELSQEQQEEEEEQEELLEQGVVPQEYTYEDLIFPYDLGFWKNITTSIGYPYQWILPWGGPNNDGYHIEKSEEFIEEDQLGLPWPPDSGHQENTTSSTINRDIELDQIQINGRTNIQLLKKRLDPRSNMKRTEWMNDQGETLDDLGVDIDAEDADHEELLLNHPE
ncbi:zinc finger family protein [Scheffersomyces coipomensis]|uniref:zinc finger family protein n=1 Tax=Scheffersomyces coipomensis TaxID=1788519 RepID=UPI00315D5BDC